MKWFLSIALAMALFSSASLGVQPSITQSVEASAENEELLLNTEAASPRILTKLVVEVYSPQEGYVAAIVTNQFTLFPSTVPVEIRLYSSYTNTTDITKMTLEGYRKTEDLDMGQSLSYFQSTNGEEKYWCAYAIYTVSSTQEEIYQTKTVLFAADGTPYPTT